MEELINRWKELNQKANKLLNEHKSFRQYNSVRLQMDKIEDELYDEYNFDVEELN